MKKNNEAAKKLIEYAIPKLSKNLPSFVKENTNAIMSSMDNLSSEQKIIISQLLR